MTRLRTRAMGMEVGGQPAFGAALPRRPSSRAAEPLAYLLVVAAEPELRQNLQRMLHAQGYHCDCAEDEAQAKTLLAGRAYDALLYEPAGAEDGGQALRGLTGENLQRAVILLARADQPGHAQLALNLGAQGLLRLPVQEQELQFCVQHALESLRLSRDNRAFTQRVQSEALRQTKELLDTIQRLERVELRIRRSYEETVHRLARATEYRDNETGRHLQRMSLYSALLARLCGWDHERCEAIRIASPMHDVGKIGIPDTILYKPGKHTPEEFEVMKGHAQIGYEILADSHNDLLDLAATIAWTHHEKWDGSGYPRRMMRDSIPLEGRIVAIADVFDALTSKRVYKPAFPVLQAQTMMTEGAGKHFDPGLLDLFFAAIPEVLDIKYRHSDPEE